MSTIRRIYAYLLALAGLALLATALADLGQVALEAALGRVDTLRDSVSRDVAGVCVGLPVWLLHWLWTERSARTDEQERSSPLRRLYLYVVLAVAVLVIGVVVEEAINDREVRHLPFGAVALAVWIAHWRIAARDRSLVGEAHASATLRRWYLYGAAYIGLLMLLSGASALLTLILRAATVAPAQPLSAANVDEAVATTLVGLTAWLVHWFLLPTRLPETVRREDGVAVLRSVYLFLTLSVGVGGALAGLSQLLYYAVARLLGVESPGGVGGNLLQAAAGPSSVAIVYGAAWAYQRVALRRQAAAFEEAPRQAGIRRLYTHLVALIALAVLAVGVTGLLWTLGDVLAGSGIRGEDTRNNVALYVTMVIVGLPVWLFHWRPLAARDAAPGSLARRLYLYLSLIAAMLALVGGAATTLYRLIGLVLGSSATTDLPHGLAVAVVAAAVAIYHWRVLRQDMLRPTATVETGAEAVVRIRAADADALQRALQALRATGVDVVDSGPPSRVN